MLDPDFGWGLFEDDNEIKRLLLTAGPHPSDSARVLYNMAYEVTTGIHDHRKQSGPFAVEQLKDPERYVYNSSLFKAMNRYVLQGIKERFGLSITEYLELPKEYIGMLSELSARDESRKKLEADEVGRKLNLN